MTDKVVLLTGAAGFLGGQVARRLVTDPCVTIVALVRGESHAAAAHRLARAWAGWPELAAALRGQVEVLCGNIALPWLGLDQAAWEALAQRVTHVIHTAADLRVDGPLDELRRTNVQGVDNLLVLARRAHAHHGLGRYAHVSTAYVAGARAGKAYEGELDGQAGFSSTYEMSKWEGEHLAQAARQELPVTVFRPGMIVGDSRTGEIKTFNTFYFPMRLCMIGALPILPANPRLPVNLIPVDYVADAITRLTFDPAAEGLTFHLTAPREALPTTGELVEFVRDWARAEMGLKRRPPLLLPLPIPRGRLHPDRPLDPAKEGRQKASSKAEGLMALLPYFNERMDFQRQNTDRLLGPYRLNWREWMPAVLDFAVRKSFLHQSGRTVHEQIVYRLASKNRPITFYDVIDGQAIRRETTQVRSDILAAAGALRALGVRPGDKVALVGHNSTRYLVLDAAIGLAGAVSVPLYYTSPPADVDGILQSSQARLLLLGAPKILERLDELQADIVVISFCRQPAPPGLKRQIMGWDEFLHLGAGCAAPPESPAALDDLATLRYTSGTTGRPKGVAFKHAGLRWMGETMAALLPWEERNRPAAYLSFLPMNHVVEGILATYCPYYVPAPVSIYFLENLMDIQRTLPHVRPHIFFAVPRVYEKVWEGFEQSALGKRFLALKDGSLNRALKQALRPLVRWLVLRKAGFDRCVQLIVGSASASEDLLGKFRAIGVEIHNAYGLTEAPLVTLNRLGANRLDTVGTPLPETELHIAEDGEVLVRGPQVAAGYFHEAETPVRDGWLYTSDLGVIQPDGSLALVGRKKELIKTSYGKYVHPAKVEALLHQAPGVVEALVMGEERPYCTALLWVRDAVPSDRWSRALDEAVVQLNHDLSHPEQVKAWAVLAYDLTIEGGDLTANLKLRRQAVARRLEAVVAALYGQGDIPSCVFHMGRAGRDVGQQG